ncbi:MAG TPA: hypothetical protein EYG99_00785 [Candidatus Pacebacteria bacterium]|nr:hypothetical protein [Candidatus Paceibacterota bacterium]
MDFLSTTSLIVISSIFGVGVIIAPIVRNTWLLRILIASYVSLSLVFLMPENFIFNTYADISYFFVFVIIFILIESGKFFDVALWNVGRFSFGSIGLSVLTMFFITAIICVFVPLANLNVFMTKDVYIFFNTYIFYIAIAPLVFSLLFSGRFRA